MPIDITQNFIRVRQKSPGLFSQFRQGVLSAAKNISAVFGKRKNTGKWEVQSLLFARSAWDAARARAWVTSHGYVYPARQATTHTHHKAPFSVHSVIENHDPDYNVLDVVVIEAGPGKNQIYLEEENDVFRENFTEDAINMLPSFLEGLSLEAYVVEGQDGSKQYIHPSAGIIQQTPVGLVPHQVGFLRDVTIDKASLSDRIRVRAKAVLNNSRLAKDLREIIKHAWEQGSQFIPAPSINGMMLWSPHHRGQTNFFDALKVLSMRSVEFVSRPAAGGAIYAVIEGERMNFFELLKVYGKKHELSGDYTAKTPAAFIESVTNPDDTLKDVQAALGDGTDPTAAMAVLTQSALATGLDISSDENTETESADLTNDPITMTEGTLDASRTGDVTVNVTTPPAPQADVVAAEAPLSDPDASLTEPVSPLPDAMSPVLEQITELTNLVRQNAEALNRQGSINDNMLQFVTDARGITRQNNMIAMVQEAVNSGLPEHRETYWIKMIKTGQILDPKALKIFLDGDKDVEGAHAAVVTENLRDLPVSTRHLAGISVGTSDRDIPKIRAKALFTLPMTESEKEVITQRGVRGYMTLDEMYKDLVPGDLGYTGIPYGGEGAKYRSWYSRNVLEGVTSGDDTVKSTDFANILLQVVGELGIQRWEAVDRSFLELTETGPVFTNYIDSNVVVYGAAPDMEEWSETTGYPDLSAGHRKPVTTTVKDWGGIMRWSKRVVIDNRLDMITEDVNAQIDATWRAMGKHVFDKLLGYSTTTSLVNGLAMDDGNGVLYQVAAPRQNYVDGDGRVYNNLVKLLHLMMEQEDISKAGQEPQMLALTPGKVFCVSNAWAVINGYFTGAYKPGTETEPNELGLPNNQSPMVIGVHQAFLRRRQDFVGMIPNPQLKGVVRVQYFNGQNAPKITWQNQPSVGRVFENGEIACQFDFPVRITLVREKGAFASFLSA